MLRNRNASSLQTRSSLRHILTPPWGKRQFYGSLKGDCAQPCWIKLTVSGKHCYETPSFVLPPSWRDRMLTCVYGWTNRSFTDFPCCSDDTSSIKGFRAIYQFSKFAGKQSIRKPTIGITPPPYVFSTFRIPWVLVHNSSTSFETVESTRKLLEYSLNESHL